MSAGTAGADRQEADISKTTSHGTVLIARDPVAANLSFSKFIPFT
jgi:hypothetical protein